MVGWIKQQVELGQVPEIKIILEINKKIETACFEANINRHMSHKHTFTNR